MQYQAFKQLIHSILVARDRRSHTVDGILKNEGADELVRHLDDRISIAAVVCADASLAHELAAAKLGFPLKELVTSSGQHVLDGIFHIQHVNAYHSHLKRWIGGVFHSVATKYLRHYLGWRRRLTENVSLTPVRLANGANCGTLVQTTVTGHLAVGGIVGVVLCLLG